MGLTRVVGRGPRPRLLALAVMIAGLAGLVGAPALAAPANALVVVPARAAQPTGGEGLGWGNNSWGQLGNGTQTDRELLPVDVALPAGVELTAVAGGSLHSLALTTDGRVFAWGDNQFGEVGIGTTGTQEPTPVQVALPAGVTAVSIAGGNYHSLAATSDGRVFAWGYNDKGQLGDGTTTTRPTPVQVALPAGVTITQVSAADSYSLALASDGRVFAWGSNSANTLGDGTTTQRLTPVQTLIPAGVNIVKVSAGDSHGLALASDGRVFAWGANYYGEIGNGVPPTDFYPTPVQTAIPAGVTISDISAGGRFSLAASSDGRVFGWGYNIVGQLGDGTTQDRYTPVQTAIPAGTTVTKVVAGGEHSLALTSDGRVLSWGANNGGQLGDGTTTDRLTPGEVTLPPDDARVIAIGAGSQHSLAVAQDRGSATSLTAEPHQVSTGESVTLTATVTCSGRIPTGTVTFHSGAQVIGTAQLDASGNATLTTNTLSEGSHQITANYEGDGACPASTSSPVTVTVTAASGTSTTHVVARPDYQKADRPVWLTAWVTCTAGTPTGTVTFTEGRRTLGTATVEDGRAILVVRDLGIGRHAVTAHYDGDAACPPSSDTVDVVIVRPHRPHHHHGHHHGHHHHGWPHCPTSP